MIVLKYTDEEVKAAFYITLHRMGLIPKKDQWYVNMFTEILRHREQLRRLRPEWYSTQG